MDAAAELVPVIGTTGLPRSGTESGVVRHNDDLVREQQQAGRAGNELVARVIRPGAVPCAVVIAHPNACRCGNVCPGRRVTDCVIDIKTGIAPACGDRMRIVVAMCALAAGLGAATAGRPYYVGEPCPSAIRARCGISAR